MICQNGIENTKKEEKANLFHLIPYLANLFTLNSNTQTRSYQKLIVKYQQDQLSNFLFAFSIGGLGFLF